MDGIAIDTLRARARQGDSRALSVLGRRLLLGHGTPPAPQEGHACLMDAAARGDGEAAALLARLAGWGALQPQSWSEALNHLQRAAELGWAPAQRELRFLARQDGDDWSMLRSRIDLEALTAPPAMRPLAPSPQVRAFDGFATPAECAWLIGLAQGSLRRAQVYRKDAEGYTEAETRTNSEADYTFDNADLVLRVIVERISRAIGLSTRLFEIAKLLHYEPGQQFAPHHDFQQPTTPALAREIARRGQRVATVLVYLNDDFDGGETEFPRIALKHRGATGDALMFANVRPDGDLDHDSLHAGLPTTRGVKWVLSQWIRSRPVDGGAA
jgi:predicted 2-oxoglutarate/Fe(II)-dependent dioxygenase YbiX